MKTVRVGLTGMSKAGKTVFLTSLIHNFTEHDGGGLDEFRFNRVRYVGNPGRLRPSSNPFPYAKLLQGLRAEPPAWPPGTTSVAEFAVELTLVRETATKPLQRACRIEFVDYPGERLADVPLLGLDFATWSADAWDVSADRPAAGLFREAAKRLVSEPHPAAHDELLEAARTTYGEYLRSACRGGHPVSPAGVAVEAADKGWVEAPFFPLPPEVLGAKTPLVRHLRQAFEAYKVQVVAPFFRHIATCDHQIVLVDVLDILRGGPERHQQVQGQIRQVMNALRRLRPGWCGRLIRRGLPWGGSPTLQRVTFCATKADQATGDGRPNLERLLRTLVLMSARQIEIDNTGLRPTYTVVSAYRSTEDVQTDHQGNPLLALRGRMAGGDGVPRLIYPGRVPEEWPADRGADWQAFRFPDFRPRPLPAIAGGSPLPHLWMDVLMYRIVEGVLP